MKYLLSLILMATSAMAQSSYSVYNSTESAAVGTQITTGILDTDTTTNGYYLTSSIIPSPHTQFWVTNAHDNALRGSFTVGSSFFTGTGDSKTYCVRANGASLTRVCRYTFPTGARTGQFAVGWYWRFSPTTDLSDFVDSFYVDIAGGDFAVAAFRDDGGASKAIRIHNNSATTVGPDIAPLTSNTTYWCTILVNTNDGATAMTKLAVFDPVTWRLLGISALAAGTKGMVNYFEFGCSSGHTINSDFRMFYDDITVETGVNAVNHWPLLPVGGTVTAASVSRTDFNTAYTNAQSSVGTNHDVVALPTGSSTWTSGYTVAKNGLVIKGNGTNNTIITGDNGASQFDLFTVTGNFNTFSNFAVKGDGTSDELTAFRNSAAYNRYSRLDIRECLVCIYAENPGLCDNSVLADSWRAGRVIFTSGFYDTYYPLAWDNTNYFVWEDCRFDWTSAKNDFAPPANAVITSQVGEAYVVRRTYIRLNGGGGTAGPQPCFDFHGDDSGGGLPRPGVAMQIYSNYIDMVSGTFSGNKFADVRGTRSLIYSNKCVGTTWSDGITYREERPSDSPNYIVNNSYEWQNYDGASGTTAMTIIDDANITAGVDYFTTALSPLVEIPYPHPLRNEVLPPSIINSCCGASIGAGRVRGVIVSRP